MWVGQKAQITKTLKVIAGAIFNDFVNVVDLRKVFSAGYLFAVGFKGEGAHRLLVFGVLRVLIISRLSGLFLPNS